MVRTSFLVRFAVCCTLARGFLTCFAAEEALVPARFTQANDGLGFRWDITPQGTIGDGSNDCFDNAAVLRVNRTVVNFSRPMMTADGSEFVISGRAGPLAVTRRIRLDATNAVVRYLEIFENTGTASQPLQVNLHTDLGNNATGTMTERDKAFAGQLAKDEGAIVAIGNSDRPGVVFLLADPKSKAKPVVQINTNRGFDMTWDLPLKAGGSVAILHYIAQRNQANSASARVLLKQFAKDGRLTDPKIPKAFTKLIANFSTRAEGEEDGVAAPVLAALQALTEAAEISRGKSDTVLLDAGAKLAGTVTGGDFAIETEFGKAQVAFADIAGLTGGGGVQRPVRIFLRSGEVLIGTPSGAKFAMATDTGLAFDIDLAQIQMLALRRGERDGQSPANASALLTTHRGDCLALAAPAAAGLQAATPWGMIQVPLAEIESLAYVREPFPTHRLVLADRSRLLVMLRGDEWQLATTRFGNVKVVPQSVRELRRAGAPLPTPSGAEDERPVTGAHCEIIGENRITGVIDLPELHLASAKSTTPLDPKTITKLEREGSDDGAEASVKVHLADGQVLGGRLTESVLPIRSGERVWRVPLAHVVAVHVPPPAKPKAEESAAPSPPADPAPLAAPKP